MPQPLDASASALHSPDVPFRAPTRVHLHPGAVARLGEVTTEIGCRRVLLVTDPGLRGTPHPGAAEALLTRSGVGVVRFDTVEPNPRVATAVAAAAAGRAAGADGVVALGGGSALDCGKAAAMLATNPGDPLALVGRNRFTQRPLPFVAVPTTCGTGSEVTWVAVLTDPDSKAKVSLKGDGMFPTIALVDADLLATLPAPVLAATAMDAFTHALEATTVRCRNPISDALAEAAMALLFAHLPAAHAGEAEARAEVMRASTLAGLAFGSADVGAVHCLSESLGGVFDVPHGLANAVLLLPVFAAHGASVATRLGELQARLFPGQPVRADEGAAHFLGRLQNLLLAVAIPGFPSLGIPPSADATLAAMAVANGSNASTPRPMGEADYRAILQAARGGTA